MPASGPTPGSTPTSVPTKQPMKPYQSTPGASATWKPSPRFWSVSSISSQAKRPARQRDAQQGIEEVERAPRHHEGEPEPQYPALALERQQQEAHHHRHGEPVAEPLEPPRGEGARRE